MRRLFTPRWLARHTLALVLVGACLALARWQLDRAAGGNGLSWGYAFQWPLFAVIVVVLWVRAARAEVLGQRGAPRPPKPAPQPLRRPTPAVVPTDDDPQHAAYNRYLAWLAANPDRRPSEYPG